MQALEEELEEDPAAHGVQTDEPLVDDVPDGQILHGEPTAA